MGTVEVLGCISPFLLIHSSISAVMHKPVRKSIRREKQDCQSLCALRLERSRVRVALKNCDGFMTEKAHLLAKETDGTSQPVKLPKEALPPSLGSLKGSHCKFIDN